MPRRYVPKTYNNRRGLRLIIGMAITFALSVVILFLSLFFIFSGYVVDGQLIIPWLMDEVPVAAAPHSAESSDDEPPDGEIPLDEPTGTTPSDTSPSANENPLLLPPGDEDLNTFIPNVVDPDTLPPDDEP